jgi:hypothetical protein
LKINHFIEIFDARFNYLRSLFQATNCISHNGEKGSLRETFIRQIVLSLLPNHFGIGSGIIVDFNGRESSQSDIIIYDKRLLPPIFEDVGRGIYPIDAVIRVLEVKSTLDNAGIIQAISAAWKLNPNNPEGLKLADAGNLPNGEANYPFFGVFSYGGTPSELATVIEKQNESRPTPMIAILGKGVYHKGCVDLIKIVGDAKIARYFMASFLHYVEEEAASRSKFGLLNWLGRFDE